MNPISSSLPPPITSIQKPALSEDQHSTISETLASYDPENLTSEEAQSIIETFSSAGIAPGRELANVMAEAGFDAHSVGELAGNELQHRPPPPQAQNQGFTEEMLTTLESLLEEYQGEDIDGDVIESITKTMQELFGLAPSGTLIDITA
ncbi:MAG: hypothetical protein KUG73_04265 [Pseudomonadales bacterium]|nr:hypothetical protein [Pseudomonadales bacterium]